ncbi:serine hydrolase [Facklamia sp. 7083-14-GEN3]|uniref:serine hydrolase n=1 Tax=Facklamia sp. 7083-14-GEN3 TaxID=2973478 RepID=UPI00215D2EDD|nr:serine hydrolase [Facklamia sp. 7083-14-GEN3]MCR8969830.1 serine hydrolase [Facklamia sp. 7083-14-GEN3]
MNSFLSIDVYAVTTSTDSIPNNQTSFQDSDTSIENSVPENLVNSMPVFEETKGAYIVDGLNGQILYTHEADQLVEVGSFSQLLLLYLIYQAIDRGQLASAQEVWISDEAYALSQDYDLPNVPLRQDLSYSLKDLIEAVSLNASRGAALALAEELTGSEAKTLKLMEEQLNEWGEEDFALINVTGVSDRYQVGDSESINQGHTNQMTAQTVATIAYHLVNEYPDYLKSSQIYQKLFQEGTSDAFEMTNPNLLIENSDSLYAMKNVDGLSASKTEEDGYNLIATTEKDGLRLIVVLLGVGENEKLYQFSKELIERAQNIYRIETVIKENSLATHLDSIKVENGKANTLKLMYGSNLKLVVPIIDTAPRLVYQFTANQSVNDYQVKAPVKAGTVVGQMQVDIADYRLPILRSGRGNYVSVKVVEDIEEANALEKTWRSIQNTGDNAWNAVRKFFTDLFN